MAELVGNLLVAQSGGPTCAINASLAGVIQEAGRHEQIEEIYGGLNGILGVLNEELIDFNDEKARTIEGLKHSPAAALGTSRYKIDVQNNPEQAAKDMDRLFEVFQAHNIRFFFYTGGHGSQDTAQKIHEEAVKRAYDLRVIGVPKTINNDLPHTDHCPGYGSAIKYNAVTVMEIAADLGGMAGDSGTCCVIEVMGRTAGWIAAGTVLAKRQPSDAPHMILLPEVPFEDAKFLAKVKETIDAQRYCIVVVGAGLKNAAGEQLGAQKNGQDATGRPVLSGAGDAVASIIQKQLKIKTRSIRLGYAQRAAGHCASAADIAEAAACGETAVRAAIVGKSGLMVKIVRQSSQPYQWTTDLQDLKEIANSAHLLPRDWISEDGFLPNEKFIEYARPLIEGELKIPYENGLPKYAVLEKVPVDKLLPARS
jgi:ATP-dependent phosphofructokinase / diphosphate-dependent phosphofructokinase